MIIVAKSFHAARKACKTADAIKQTMAAVCVVDIADLFSFHDSDRGIEALQLALGVASRKMHTPMKRKRSTTYKTPASKVPFATQFYPWGPQM